MKPNKKIIILAFFSMLGIGSIIYFIAIPSVSEIQLISQQISDERRDLEIKYQRGQLLKEIKKNINAIMENSELIEGVFLTSGQELEFITELENLGKKYGIEPEFLLREGEISDSEGIKTIPLSLTVKGNYNDILEYLRALEVKNEYIIIKNLRITRSGSGDVTANIVTNTYSK